MTLKNFIDNDSTNPITAEWANSVDILLDTIFGTSITKAAARTALTTDAPWSIAQGGTGATTEAGVKANLNLEIGIDVQAQNATLQSLSSLGSSADVFPYTTGVNTWAESAISAFGRSLVDDANQTAAAETLGYSDSTDVAKGDAFIAGKKTLANAVAFTLHDYHEERTVVVRTDFGSVEDGVADDTTAFQNAINSLGDAGGTVLFTGTPYIGSNLTIKNNVSLIGPHHITGISTPQVTSNYTTMSGCIRLSSTATITIESGGGIKGCLIYRYGMTFPPSDATAYAGTAITIGGDDTFVVNSMILGFDKAIYSTGYQRGKFQKLRIDCQNGIDLATSADVADIKEVHCWPFANIDAAGGWSKYHRLGTAFNFSGTNDGTRISDCFSYGYKYGFHINDASVMVLQRCTCDFTSAAPLAGSTGFWIEGGTTDIEMVGCYAYAFDRGVYFNHDYNGYGVRISQSYFAQCVTAAIMIAKGNAFITKTRIQNTPVGIEILSSGSSVFVDFCDFASISTKEIRVNGVTNYYVYVGPNNYYDAAAGSSVLSVTGGGISTIQDVPSAAPLLLPPTGNVFTISGTTSFGTLSGGWKGRRVTLIFLGALTITNGSALKLQGATNFTTSADDVLELIHDGSGGWREIGRSVN